MNKLERFDSLSELLRVSGESQRADMWTTMPGYIVSFDPSNRTCSVKIALKVRVKNIEFGTPGFIGDQYNYVQISMLTDCPVIFPSGGGYTLTFPIKSGDECLVLLASRSIDNWWDLGGLPLGDDGLPQSQNATNVRMHNLSDGFILVGVNSRPNVIPAISINSVQLRNDAGDTFIEIQGTTINFVSPTQINVTAPTTVVNSTTATINASGTATISAASIVLKNTGAALKKMVNDSFVGLFNGHVHTNGNGGGNTGTSTTTASSSNTTSTVQAE